MFYWQEDSSKIQQGQKMLKMVEGAMVLFWYLHFSGKCQCKLRRPLDTVDLEEPLDSCERTGAPVLWLSCEGQADVLELPI